MKQKLTLLILALVTSMGAWATVTQPTLTTDEEHPVYYTIQSKRSSGYATYNGASLQVTHEPGIGYGSVWYFVENGEGVSIVPAADPTKKLASTTSATAEGIVWYLKESYNAGYFCVSRSATDVTSGTNTTQDCWDASNASTNIGTWCNKNGDADGTSWTIASISSEDVATLRTAYTSMIPDIPEGKYLSVVGTQATTIEAASSGSDNDNWYIISQDRGGNNTPIYNNGFNTALLRAAAGITPTSLDNSAVSSCTRYLVRFVDAGDGLFNVQFADGSYIVNPTTSTPGNGATPKPTTFGPRAKFAFTLIGGSTRFSWNLHTATGKSMDNNGANSTVSYWGEGTVGDGSSSKSWMIYPVTFTDVIAYPFNTTDGAFFSNLETNKAAADGNYCNLWLSKNAADKPQVKLISNQAVTSGANYGNNMRSSGGLYTTATSHQYNISVSEGKIISYTIVGTAVGALSITPAGGSATEYSASDEVRQKVTLASSAKETYFTLTGSSQWLNVTQFLIEWESDATLVENTSDVTNDGIYMMSPHNAERGVLYAGTTYLDACGGHANTNYPANKNVAIDASDANQQFVLYTYGGNTYLYNIGRAKFAGTADGLYYKLTNCPSNKWTVTDGAYSGYFHITSQADSKMATLNAWVNTGSADSKDYAITGTTANEEANNFMLNRVGSLTTEQQAAIESIIANYETLMSNLDKLEEYTIGTGVGEYTNADFPTEEYKETYITNIRTDAADYDASTLSSVKDASATSISGMVLNSVPANAFYRIEGYATNKYAKAGTITASNVDSGNDPSSKIPNSANQETDGSDIWYYDTGNHLINYKNGLGTFATRAFASLDKTKETTTFSESTCSAAGAKKIGVYELKSNYSGSKVWYSNTDNVDRNSANDHVNCEWVVTKVTSLPITMNLSGGAYYATINLPVAVTIPSGLSAYSAIAAENVLTLTKVVENGVLAANQPVILYSKSDGFDKLAIATTAGTEDATNELSGTIAAETVTPNANYVLGEVGSTVGFYKYGGKTMPGFKAYLSTGANVKGFTFSFEDIEDAIRAIESENSGLEIYDIAGRRVQKAQKGLYIVNGKKVLFK